MRKTETFSLFELTKQYPTEESASDYFSGLRWGNKSTRNIFGRYGSDMNSLQSDCRIDIQDRLDSLLIKMIDKQITYKELTQ